MSVITRARVPSADTMKRALASMALLVRLRRVSDCGTSARLTAARAPLPFPTKNYRDTTRRR